MREAEGDDWVAVAMADEALAADVLMRLSEALTPAPFRWGQRQPRSRHITRAEVPCAKTMEEADEERNRRGSPTTPLSWSSGDGSETSSSRSTKTMSKAATEKEVHPSKSTPTSRSTRKRKTLDEFKEEKSMLLKENIELKQELESLNATFKEIREKNEILKTQSLDMQLNLLKPACSGGFLIPDLNLPMEEDESGSETHSSMMS